MARETDEQIDRLLRQVFKPGAGTAPVGDCPDAELLAAWVDGRLTGAMQSAAVSHLSTCGRCQAIVAELSKMGPFTEEPEVWWRRGLRVRWLVPMTAAAAAVVIWLVVPSAPPSLSERETPQAARQAEREPPAAVAPSAPDTVPAAPVPPALPTQAGSAAESDRERTQAAASDRRLESPTAAPVARDERADSAADRAAPMKAEADAAIGGVAAAKKETPEARTAALRQGTAVAPFTVSSPARSVAWRIGADGAIARSSDGGSTWDIVADDLGVNLLAGASPSPNVCWLVGTSGTVLVSIDGRRFTRLPFPENVDLAAVQATDGRIAQVTASGGRIFRTTDGGQTWTEARPQDF